MLNIGFWELFLIVVVGLLVIGPKQLPEVAKTVARAVRKIRRTTDELRDSARDVVHEVIPPEDLYGYGDDDDDRKKPRSLEGTAPYELPPPLTQTTPISSDAASADAEGALKKDESPPGGDSSLAS